MRIHMLAGGPPSLIPDCIGEKEDVLWVGVDRGAAELVRRGIQPGYVFGDFDSATPQEKQDLENSSDVYVYPAAKDKTDMELALDWAMGQHPDAVVLFGGTGGRLDHELANLQLLKRGIKEQIPIEIMDRQNRVTAMGPGTYRLEADESFPYISFLPWGTHVEALTLEGFKYPLADADIDASSLHTVSNEFSAKKGTFSFENGIVILIRSRDLMS